MKKTKIDEEPDKEGVQIKYEDTGIHSDNSENEVGLGDADIEVDI